MLLFVPWCLRFCAQGRIPGAFLTGKTWNIPAEAEKPLRRNAKRSPEPATLLNVLPREIALTYNANHMEGSRLSHGQTRFIFETNTVGLTDETVDVPIGYPQTRPKKCPIRVPIQLLRRLISPEDPNGTQCFDCGSEWLFR